MQMAEIVDEVSFVLGLTATDNVEEVQIERAILSAFRELKRYMKTPVDKTVPFSTRIDLKAVGIDTVKILGVRASNPRLGLTLSSIDSGNIFQVAAAANVYSHIGNTASLNVQPIVTEMAMAQVRNTLRTDFQWNYDVHNQVILLAHAAPRPTHVTVRYVPNYNDVSEIVSNTWIDYLIRLSIANMKAALGRIRSKYKIEGSNVTLDGDTLLAEAQAELEKIREELSQHKNRMQVLN